MPTFYTNICLLGLGGNLLVIITFFYFKRLRNMTDIYLLNLAFADLLFVLSLPLWVANSTGTWTLGMMVCKIMHTVYRVSFYSSMFLLSSISMDRYFIIAKAITAYRHRSKALFASKVTSGVIWVIAIIFSMPEIRSTTIIGKRCTPYSSMSDKTQVPIQASQIAFAFVLPLLVMSFCYCSIIKTLCQSHNFERNEAIKVTLTVVIVFLVSQLPYNMVLFWKTHAVSKGYDDCHYENVLQYAMDVTQCLAFLRCCLNPFIYAFVGVKFHQDLLKLLKDCGCISQERFYRYMGQRRKSSGFTNMDSTTITYSP